MKLRKELRISIAGFVTGITYYIASKISGDQTPFLQSRLGIIVAVVSAISILSILYANYKQK